MVSTNVASKAIRTVYDSSGRFRLVLAFLSYLIDLDMNLMVVLQR